MKVTINADGSVSFEVGSAAEALALAREFQNGAKPVFKEPKPVEDSPNDPAELPVKKKDRITQKKRHSDTELLATARAAGLTVASYVVWEFLVNHEDRRGVSISEIARQFRLTNAAAGQRLLVLVKAGYAERVKVGHYRAATP
jgi:hypothetical protein